MTWIRKQFNSLICPNVIEIHSWVFGDILLTAGQREPNGGKISPWILCFPLQVPARSAGRITAQGQGRRPPCCCAPGCLVSRGRGRSGTRTEGSFAGVRGKREEPRPSHQYSTSGTKNTKSLWCIMGHNSSDNCRDCFIIQRTRTHTHTHTHSFFKNLLFSQELFLNEKCMDQSYL